MFRLFLVALSLSFSVNIAFADNTDANKSCVAQNFTDDEPYCPPCEEFSCVAAPADCARPEDNQMTDDKPNTESPEKCPVEK